MTDHDSGLDKIAFTHVMRGYDPAAVDEVLRPAEQALASQDEQVRAAAAAKLHDVDFPVVMRGYDRDQVVAYLAMLGEQLTADPVDRAADAEVGGGFTLTVRGYDVEQVDALLRQAGRALVTAELAGLAAARDAVRAAQRERTLKVRWFGGYDRSQVDQFLANLERRLGEAALGG